MSSVVWSGDPITPEELAELTVDFYKRNYIEGLFLSCGVKVARLVCAEDLLTQ